MNQGFSYYFCMMIEGFGSGFIPPVDQDPAQKHVDPVDPDPQHWFRLMEAGGVNNSGGILEWSVWE